MYTHIVWRYFNGIKFRAYLLNIYYRVLRINDIIIILNSNIKQEIVHI